MTPPPVCSAGGGVNTLRLSGMISLLVGCRKQPQTGGGAKPPTRLFAALCALMLSVAATPLVFASPSSCAMGRHTASRSMSSCCCTHTTPIAPCQTRCSTPTPAALQEANVSSASNIVAAHIVPHAWRSHTDHSDLVERSTTSQEVLNASPPRRYLLACTFRL